MTTRGNNPSSISPPVQIQPRHVSNLPSGTPPPNQQLYPGPSPGLVQGPAFNFIQGQYPQSEQLLSYQAYGSAPNDLRGPNVPSGRGGGPANMAQSGSYYQTGQNMRPSQPPPPNPYYIGQTNQGAMRHPRPTHGSANQPIVFVPNTNNMVISTNMYQQARMPMYPQGAPQFQSRYSQPSAVMYFNGVPRTSVTMQAPGMGPPPLPREKRIINISDPVTGRNITDEIINSSHQTSAEEKPVAEESSMNDKGVEIRKNFTRQVVERMKTGEFATPAQPATELSHSGAMQQNQPNMEHPHTSYPSGPSQQVQSNPSLVSVAPVPGSLVRPPIRMTSPAINLSVPPPQLPANIVYQRHGHPSQPQTNSAQAHPQSHPPMPSKVVAPSAVGAESTVPISQPVDSPVPHVSNDTEQGVDHLHPQPKQDVIPDNDIPVPSQPLLTTVSSHSTSQDEQSGLVDIQPPKDIITQVDSVDTEPTPTIESNVSAIPVLTPDLPIDSSVETSVASMSLPSNEPSTITVPVDIVSDEATIEQLTEQDTVVKEDAVSGTTNQSTKDVRKGKKNKKDFSQKESGGSEMDAFIDGKDSGVDSEPGHPSTNEARIPEDVSVSVMSEESPVVESVTIETPVEEASQKISESEAQGATMPSSFEKQNGELISSEVQTSVPLDNQGVPEEDPSKDDDELVQENGPSDDDVEVSKAEHFAQLKKSGGKLVYDRAYLMELRECVSSQTKPDGLPPLEIILDQPTPFLSRPSGGPADFTPAFFQSGGNQRHAPPIGKSSSRGRQRPGDMPGTPRIIKSLSMSTDVKLRQSENPWKAKKDENLEPKTLESEILFIMNRLTPTNFEKLAGEMKSLKIKTYDDLKHLVNIFFDKVTIETKFVEAYALLCKVMSGLKVPPPTDGTVKDNMATFRVVMLTKCQQEFEADKSVVFESPEEKKKKMEAENPESTPERDVLIEKTLYHMKLKRMKFYGNIRFIGELFKLGMLTENIMHDCIFRLLKARDDDSLVSLCNLLTTVGRLLDTDKAKPRMDQYFSQMSKIADERKSRIKFTLRDVIDLRLHHWVPRKEATGPKKINEVHKDYAQEQARNQYLASQPPPPRNDNVQAGNRKGSRQRQEENRTSEDGWNTVSSNKMRMPIDANKMKISKSVVDDNIQLGPGGGSHRPMWSRGSHGGAQPQDDRPTLAPNRFSALTNDDVRKPSYPRSPSRGEGSAGRGHRQGQTAGHGRGKLMTRPSQEGDRRDAIANTRSFMGGRSQNSSRDNSWNRDDRRQFMGPRSSYERDNPMTRSDSAVKEFKTPAPPAVKQMSEDDISKKSTNILDEYLNIRDLEEARLCVKELKGQNQIHLFITSCINHVLEKKNEQRDMAGNLFHELVSASILNVSAYIKGLNEVLQFASDMVVDIPTLWACLAQVISPLLAGGSLTWPMLKEAMSPHLDNRDGAKLMAYVLSQCAEKQGEKEVSQKWQSSGLSWSMYLKEDEVESFVKEKNLDYTLSGGSGSTNPLSELESMIRNRTSNSLISTYIEKSSPNKSDASFIRALTTSIVSSSFTEKRYSADVVMSHKDILKRYIGNDLGQLQALYAIQTLMAKLEHPSGVLSKLFQLFYDENIVEEDVFYKWEKCTDPQEQEAKGTCIMQTRQFFVWLRENEDPETES